MNVKQKCKEAFKYSYSRELLLQAHCFLSVSCSPHSLVVGFHMSFVVLEVYDPLFSIPPDIFADWVCILYLNVTSSRKPYTLEWEDWTSSMCFYSMSVSLSKHCLLYRSVCSIHNKESFIRTWGVSLNVSGIVLDILFKKDILSKLMYLNCRKWSLP